MVAGPKRALAQLAPLLEAHSRFRPVRVVESNSLCASQLVDAASLLVIGDSRRSPRTALPGMFVRALDGRRIPTGGLPDAGERLSDYARIAAKVVQRTPLNMASGTDLLSGHVVKKIAPGPFVLLGEFSQRALQWVDWFSAELPQHADTFRWTAERITRQDLVAGLRSGAGAAFYFGHGTPYGWFGYGGFDKSDAVAARGRSIGCVISFSCSVARRPVKGLSFCEELVLSGFCAAAIGSTGLSLHHRNVQWSLALGRMLSRYPSIVLGDLLSHPSIPVAALNSYRILGDPMAPLIGDSECGSRSRKVFAPDPKDELPLVPLGALPPAIHTPL